MSFQASFALDEEFKIFRKSSGTLCTIPEEILFEIIKNNYKKILTTLNQQSAFYNQMVRYV